MRSQGLRWVAPVERIEPPALFDYLSSRRRAKSAGGELVTSPEAARRVREALRNHELVAIAADRDVGSPTLTVDFFGHPARLPSAPATGPADPEPQSWWAASADPRPDASWDA